MNNNATVPFCQFPTRRPLAYQWVIEYAKECRMQLEFLVLYQILAEVEALDDSGNWGYHGQCCLSIQSIADTWGMSPATVRSAIKCLELAGIITVQHSRGRSSNTITVTPHTTWIVTNFQELRAITNKGKRAPILSRSPNTDAVDAVDNITVPDAVDTVTDAVDTVDIPTNTDAHITDAVDTVTPSPNGKQAPILKPKLNTVTDTNGNGYRHNAYANNIPSSVIGSLCPEDIKAKYCKRAPITDAHAVTPLTVHVMDSSGNVVDTVALTTNTDADAISKGKSRKSRKGKSYPPSPNQYADNADDDDALPIFNMNYSEYRASELWHRK